MMSLAASTSITQPFAPRARANTCRRSVAMRASESEQSIPVSLGALGLRLAQGALMVHNGLDKLADPDGFAEFVVSQHLDFLPDALTPEQWTIGAAGVEIVAVFVLVAAVPGIFKIILGLSHHHGRAEGRERGHDVWVVGNAVAVLIQVLVHHAGSVLQRGRWRIFCGEEVDPEGTHLLREDPGSRGIYGRVGRDRS